MWVQVPSPAPCRSKLCIACSDFFHKSQSALTPLLLLFRKKSRLAHLFGCKRLTTVRCRYQLLASYEGSNPTAENAKISFSCGLNRLFFIYVSNGLAFIAASFWQYKSIPAVSALRSAVFSFWQQCARVLDSYQTKIPFHSETAGPNFLYQSGRVLAFPFFAEPAFAELRFKFLTRKYRFLPSLPMRKYGLPSLYNSLIQIQFVKLRFYIKWRQKAINFSCR
ncbi:MAG: hypothetical protein ACLRVT_06915 [Oscillospiraceae bacterium]